MVLHALIIGFCARADDQSVNFDDLLEKTSYAVLLKELISLSDSIGLLRCRMQKDERRFVEDSILGKAVRVQDLFQRTDLACASEDDIEYLYYWISLAKGEVLPQLLSKYIADLEQVFSRTCASGFAMQGKES
jgi:hypothetical protein